MPGPYSSRRFRFDLVQQQSPRQPDPGTRPGRYRCSLPGLTGFAAGRRGGTDADPAYFTNRRGSAHERLREGRHRPIAWPIRFTLRSLRPGKARVEKIVRSTSGHQRGEVAEWSKALDWSSSRRLYRLVGSNPTLSASHRQRPGNGALSVARGTGGLMRTHRFDSSRRQAARERAGDAVAERPRKG